MNPRLRPPTRSLLLALTVCALPAFAQALDTACVKAITQANLKQIEAPAFQSIKRFSGMSLEVIKANGKLYQRMGTEPWAAAPFSLQELRNAVAVAEKTILKCERGGIDTLDGQLAQVFKLSIKDPMGEAVTLQVWVGTRDGLPYRQESVAIKATTSYGQVKVPI